MTTENAQKDSQAPTIGVFDSGFGGLTVLRALLPLIPGAHYVYLGDTARLPYGAKSPSTIARYAVEAAKFLESKGADLLLIACNTATALALDAIKASTKLPVIGVIDPGARAAAASSNGDVLVLATEATVASNAYTKACNALNLNTIEKACPLLVPLVEEGWLNHKVTRQVLTIYLREALELADSKGVNPASLLLACTHYPLLEPQIRAILRSARSRIQIIDSAQAAAEAVAKHFPQSFSNQPASCTFYATDSIEKFQRLGSKFLGHPIPEVHLVDLGG